jgi:two-component sensor histidine kinase
MRSLIADLGIKKSYPVDFALVPVAIILIEISVFFTQLPGEIEKNLDNLVLLRIVHTAAMLLIAYSVSWGYRRINLFRTNFATLALTGIVVIALGDATHFYLAKLFDIELVSIYRRIGVIFIQGGLWFPAFLFIGGNRKEIISQIKKYENRLLVATRIQSRTSREFKETQKSLQERIQSEFRDKCREIWESINQIKASGKYLAEQYSQMKPFLGGESLRTLSRSLDGAGSGNPVRTSIQSNRNSILFFLQEFRVLYLSTARSTPLHHNSYSLVLIGLATPPYIYFYSLREFLIFYPLLLISVFALSRLIVKTQSGASPNALRNASILTFATGLLPFLYSSIGQAIYHDPDTQFPIYITALIFPIVYLLAMESLQILRPSALNLIKNDELVASASLQSKVQNMVKEEAAKNLSHEWAVYIHGKVLTRLAATSLKLDAAATSNDVQAYNETVDSLLALLSNPGADFEEVSTDLQSEVISRLDPWRGLLEINLHIDAEIASLQNSRVRDIGQVIEELISNSIRHGRAQNIDLKVVRASDQEIEIIAIDDSIVAPLELQNRSGLGTRIFNLASDGRWSLLRVENATEFRLTMGLEA